MDAIRLGLNRARAENGPLAVAIASGYFKIPQAPGPEFQNIYGRVAP